MIIDTGLPHYSIDTGLPHYSISEVRSLCINTKTERTELNSKREMKGTNQLGRMKFAVFRPMTF